MNLFRRFDFAGALDTFLEGFNGISVNYELSYFKRKPIFINYVEENSYIIISSSIIFGRFSFIENIEVLNIKNYIANSPIKRLLINRGG